MFTSIIVVKQEPGQKQGTIFSKNGRPKANFQKMRLAQSKGTEPEIDKPITLKYPTVATAIEDYLINCLDTKDRTRNFPPYSADRYFSGGIRRTDPTQFFLQD